MPFQKSKAGKDAGIISEWPDRMLCHRGHWSFPDLHQDFWGKCYGVVCDHQGYIWLWMKQHRINKLPYTQIFPPMPIVFPLGNTSFCQDSDYSYFHVHSEDRSLKICIWKTFSTALHSLAKRPKALSTVQDNFCLQKRLWIQESEEGEEGQGMMSKQCICVMNSETKIN